MGPKRDQTGQNFANGSHRTKIDQNMPKQDRSRPTASAAPKQDRATKTGPKSSTGPCYQNMAKHPFPVERGDLKINSSGENQQTAGSGDLFGDGTRYSK
jgi:hypothetical protein